MVEINPDEIVVRFPKGHGNQEIAASKADFQLQGLAAGKDSLPIRVFIDIQKIGMPLRDFGGRRFCRQ